MEQGERFKGNDKEDRRKVGQSLGVIHREGILNQRSISQLHCLGDVETMQISLKVL